MVIHCRPSRNTFQPINYIVDSEKLSSFIRQYLKYAVASGELVHMKEKCASSSFKLSLGSPVAKPANGGEKSQSAGASAKAQTPTKNPHAAGKAKGYL